VHACLDDLVIALYVTIDELLEPRRGPGRRPRLSDAELLCLAVAQVLLGYRSERRWLRAVAGRLGHLFPYVCGQAAYNRRLRRAAPLVATISQALALACPSWCDQWRLLDATPVPCGASRPTIRRSELAGWAGYGYCASHSRFFWGLRLHLIATPAGLPIAFALANPKTDERTVARDLFECDPDLLAARPGQTIIADKGYASAEFEGFLAEHGATLIRPARKDEAPRPGGRFLKPLRQIIESINATLKTQLSLELHGGHSQQGVLVRVLQRLLALTATIWHNHHTNQPTLRSLTAYDH
jgi:hypothetical protein